MLTAFRRGAAARTRKIGAAGILAQLTPAVALFLLARVCPAGLGAPFAAACFAAGLAAGTSGIAMGIGVISAVVIPGHPAALCAGISCALAWIVHGLMEKVRAAMKKSGRSEVLGRDGRIALTAGLAAVGGNLLFASNWIDGVLGILGATCAMAVAPVYFNVMRIKPGRTRLIAEERIAAMLTGMTLLMGTSGLYAPARFLLAEMWLLMMAGSGAAMGALTGVLAGAAMCLSGASIWSLAVLSLTGVGIGAVARISPKVTAGVFFLAVEMAALFTDVLPEGIPIAAVAAVLAGGYVAIPQTSRDWLATHFSAITTQAQIENDALARRVQTETAYRMTRVRDAFQSADVPSMGVAAKMIERMAERAQTPLQNDCLLTARAERALTRVNFPRTCVTVLRAEETEFSLWLEDELWTAENARRAADVLGEELGMRLVPVPPRPGMRVEQRLHLVEKCPFCLVSATESLPAEGESVNGDTAVKEKLPGARVMLAVSDGMGTGENARRESTRTLEMLTNLLLADIPCGEAISAVNAMLQFSQSQEMYATLDLVLINLRSGEAEMYKHAASASFVLRGRRVECLQTDQLPLGIVSGVNCQSRSIRLQAGDRLVMMSDGLSDALGGIAAAADRIRRMYSLDPGAMARRLIAEGAGQKSSARRDDMTAVCVRLEKNR